MVGGSFDAETFENAIRNVREQTSGFSQILKSLGGVLKSFGAGLASMAITMAVTWTIQKAIEAIDNYVHRYEIAIDKMNTANDKIKDINKGFENNSQFVKDNTEAYLKLRKGINTLNNENINLSDEEYKEFLSINQQFAEMFPDLIKGFDDQGGAILALGTNADTSREKLAELLEQQKRNAQYEIFQNLDDVYEGVKANFALLDKAQDKFDATTKSANEFIRAYESLSNIDTLPLTDTGDLFIGEALGADAERAIWNGVANFYNKLGNKGRSNLYQQTNGFVGSINDLIEAEYDEVNNTYRVYLRNIDKLDEDTRAALMNSIQANAESMVRQYEDLVGNTSNELKQAQNTANAAWMDYAHNLAEGMQSQYMFASLDENAQELAYQLVSNMDSSIRDAMADGEEFDYDYVRDHILSGLQTAFESEDGEAIQGLYKAILDPEDYNSLMDMPADKAKAMINQFILSISKYIDNADKIDLGKLFGLDPVVLQDEIDQAKQAIKGSRKYNGSTLEFDPEDEKNQWVDSLSQNDLNILIKGKFNGKESLEDLQKWLENAKKEAEANSPTLSPEFDMSALSAAGEDLKSLKSLYDQYRENIENNPTKPYLDLTEVEGLRDKLEGIVGVEDFNAFESLVTNANSSASEVEAAFNQMATAYAAAQINMQGATAKTAEMLRTQLQEWGFTKESVDQYVNAMMIAETANSSFGLSQDQAIANLQNMATQLGITDEQLALYIMEAAQAGYIKLDGDISFLEQLVSGLGGAIDALRMYKAAFSAGGTAITKNQAEYERAKGMKKLKTDTDAASKSTDTLANSLLKMGKTATQAGKSAGGAGGAAKDAAEETSDVMSTLSGQLDEIQAAYKDLKDIMDDYNETGKISVDQAQTILTSDFRYLALLSDESGALALNEQGFVNLAQAKLNEMQITLVRNAIDTVNSLTSEAEAAKYLSNAYIELGNNALTASQQALAAAVNAAHARGAMQGAAADMIAQGAQNALSMLQNVDFSAQGMGAASGSSDSKDSSGDSSNNSTSEEVEEKYEEDFDWIERLLERLTKITEKWQKQASRFFTFWNKNWAINQQIKSGRDEVDANKRAYTYYMKQAADVGLDVKYRDLVEKGGFSVETIENKELGEKIEKYEEWYDKAQKCKETIQDLYETEQELIKSKLDNIVDYYDTLDSYYSSIVSKIDAQIGVKAAAGQRTTIEDLLRQYAANLDYYNNARDAQLKYQMGLAINEAVTVDTAEAAIDETRKVYVGTNAYETLTERRDELQDKLDEYNQSLQDIADTKAEIAEARKNRDAEEQKRLNAELKELQKISKSYKFTTAEKREFTSINKKLEVFSTILSDKTYYDEISEIVDNYLERIDDYTVLTEQIKELNKELRTQKDKDVRKSIQEQIKDFQKQAKEANLSGKEKKELKKLQQQLEDYDITGDTTVTRNYAQAYATQQRLLERQAEAQRLSDVLDADTQSLLQARLDKNTDDIKYYQKAVAQDKRDLNKTKLKANEEKLLKALTGQLDAIAKIQDIGVVDNLVASTATYQRLLQNIGNLQSKEKLSLAEQTKLNMYLDELAAINEGVLVDDLSSYVSNYEKWWKLNQIENKTQAQWQQFLKLDDLKTSLETAYQSYLTGLQQDLQDAIESINASTNVADLEYNKKQTEEAIRKAYADRTAAEEATIKDTTEYQTILATIKNLEDDEAALLKKGKGLSPANKAKLEKARRELEALETGATLANIKEYKKYWEYVNDDKRLQRYNNGTLSAAEATTYDLYMKYLRQWNEEREEVFGDIEKELQEQLQKLDIEYDTRLNELEAEKYERLQTMYETAKTLAEAQINQYQRTIDNLDAQIENYKSIADLLSSLDLTTIRKYNINEIFDMDGNATLEELLYSKVRDAGKKSQELINDLVKQADLYQELIDAGTSEGFEGILEDYRSQASEEMQSVLDDVIKQLNENDYTDSEWITEWQQNLAEITDQIVDTIQSVQELADKMRQVTFANIQRALDMNESLVSQLSAQAGIFEDAWMRDAEGITQYGYARASILGQQMTVLQDQVRNYAEMVRKIDEAQKNEDTRYATQDDYWKARNEALVNYYNSIGSLEDVTNQIYQIGKEAQESEITNVKTIIDLRKKELSTKKALYEYDKNLKKQTKSVEELRAQIDALNDISTADALAQKAQLEAQLAEAEENLEDMQIEHQFDLETQAFDNFIADLDKTLTDANDTVYETFEEFAATIKEILSAASGADVEGAIQNITDLLMGEGYKDPSFEAGSFSTSNGTYTPLSQSDFLTGLGFTDPSTLDANAHLSNMNDLLAQIFDNMATKITTEIEDLAKNANQNNITINQNYDSLLNVNGSIDKTVVDSVEALLRESYSYTREKLYAELQKLGIVRTY